MPLITKFQPDSTMRTNWRQESIDNNPALLSQSIFITQSNNSNKRSHNASLLCLAVVRRCVVQWSAALGIDDIHFRTRSRQGHDTTVMYHPRCVVKWRPVAITELYLCKYVSDCVETTLVRLRSRWLALNNMRPALHSVGKVLGSKYNMLCYVY